MSTLGLVFGTFDLVDTHGSAYSVETLAEGTDWGKPQPIEVAIRSLLQDGSIVFTQGYDNREVVVRVIITAPDSAALTDGENALFAEIGRRSTLTYTHPDGFSEPTVFGVITSSLDPLPDDLADVRGQRTYVVRMVCAPFGRSAEEVVTPALPASGSSSTTEDSGSSTTGWTGSGTVAVASGQVRNSSASVVGESTDWLQRTFAAPLDTSSTKYLRLDVYQAGHGTRGPYQFDVAADSLPVVTADGVALTRVASEVLPSGLKRMTYYVPAASVTTLRLSSRSGDASDELAYTRVLGVDQIVRTDVRPSLGTARQMLRTLAVPGSASAPATLVLEHATSALGDAILYVFPDDGRGYVPALGNYRTTVGGETVDGTLVSGKRVMLDTKQFYEIPAASLYDGTHQVIGRIRGSGSGTVTLTTDAQMVLNGTDLLPEVEATTTHTLTTAWRNVVLGNFLLPPPDIGNPDAAKVRVTIIDDDTSGVDVDLDELWLFNISIGYLICVECGTAAPASGGTSKRLFVLPATAAMPRPRVLRGHAADGSDAFHQGVSAWMDPILKPPAMGLFTVTSNAENADSSSRMFPHWFTHAGRVA